MGKHYSVEMEGEKDDGGRKPIVPEGDQVLIIKKVELVSADESKSGFPYFWWYLESKDEGIEIKTVTTLKKGKRWLLKQILSACEIEAKEDDPEKKYDFYEEDVIDKPVTANIEHIKETFTGREGKEITFTKAKVKYFKSKIPATVKKETKTESEVVKPKKEDVNKSSIGRLPEGTPPKAIAVKIRDLLKKSGFLDKKTGEGVKYEIALIVSANANAKKYGDLTQEEIEKLYYELAEMKGNPETIIIPF